MATAPPDVGRGLRAALADGELFLHYQPIVDLNDASLGGVEALLRWRHESGVLAAGSFLPGVSDAGLHAAISAFAFDEAGRQAATWRRRFPAWIFPVAVNVSRFDFTEGLVERVIETRTRHALPPGAIAVDVSEPLLLTDLATSSARVAALKRAGAQIVVDDFGTTHASGADTDVHPPRTTDELLLSITSLESFTIDVLKVDRELVDRCFRGPRDLQVVESLVRLGHLYGYRLLAEGIESGEEAEALRGAGFDLAQGYYFQRPHGPGHIDRLLHDLADARQAFAAHGNS